MFYTYLWMDGDTFDALAFHKVAGEGVGGSVGERKRMVGGRAEIYQHYWRSAKVTDLTVHTLDDAVCSLLTSLRDTVAKARAAGAGTVMLEVVQAFKDAESISGLFLSTETIALLDELGVSLDFDIVHDLS